MKPLSKICQSCGNRFYKKYGSNHSFLLPRKKFCSQICLVQSRVGKIAWNRGKVYSGEEKKQINLSGLEKGRGLRKGKKFPELSGENSPVWKPKTLFTCPICKKEMTLAPWEKRRKYCSLTCRGLDKRGANSPVWKGENAKTKIRTRIMQMAEYTEWRLSCFRRDKFTCQECLNPKSRPLEIHHIKPYAIIKREYGFKTPEQARLCEELWDIKNGKTLCRTCHRATDTYAKNLK